MATSKFILLSLHFKGSTTEVKYLNSSDSIQVKKWQTPDEHLVNAFAKVRQFYAENLAIDASKFMSDSLTITKDGDDIRISMKGSIMTPANRLLKATCPAVNITTDEEKEMLELLEEEARLYVIEGKDAEHPDVVTAARMEKVSDEDSEEE